MENRINIAILLKNCPTGMELDCTIFSGLEFDRIDENNGAYPIICRVKAAFGNYHVHTFTKHGCYSTEMYSKCAIFPKGKTTWEGFHRPFKDGDIVYNRLQKRICIYYYIEDEIPCINYCRYNEHHKTFEILNNVICIAKQDYRLATEEEKQRFFDIIKANGYKWNTKTKTLERLIEPTFKVGNVIQDKYGYKVRITEVNIEDECYGYESMIAKGIGGIAFREQDNWELVHNKFDIHTLTPLQPVLVRNTNGQVWTMNFFSHIIDTNKGLQPSIVCVSHSPNQCIPYKGNEFLRGTADECKDFYKTWE